MPRGPKGEKRSADVIGNAVHVMRIATGEITDDRAPADTPEVQFARSGGLKGGIARAKVLTPQRRREIAKSAAKKRWQSKGK
jgi:hypothetical protein